MNNTQYNIEGLFLSEYAAKSNETKGRAIPCEECPYRTEFQRDRDRILHSKAFRRLKHKTQVFLSPEGDHYRTRLTHTLEVAQIARTIARALKLNEDLVEAISLGHDIGHTPFGHAGENTLNKLNPEGFEHNVHSLRVCDYLENDGAGLNLTFEVRDGILNHKFDCVPATLEGRVVAYADRIAYVNHDIEDAISANILTESDVPITLSYILGDTKSKRINTLITDIINQSYDKNVIALSPEIDSSLEELRRFMFDRVYRNPIAKSEEIKACKMIETLYEYYLENPITLPEFYYTSIPNVGVHNAITDYIASMTDRYAITEFSEIFVPKNWNN